jgi:beta-lactamase superfamily II metal-dependent hydrolase
MVLKLKNQHIKKTTLKVLPVKCGDAFHLRLTNKRGEKLNMLVDGGYIGTYATVLLPLLDKIKNSGQSIDLWVLTHLDADHINGAVEFFRKNEDAKNLVKEFWFNFFNRFQVSGASSKISLNKGIQLRELLQKNRSLLIKKNITKETRQYKFGSARIEILSPDLNTFNELNEHWEKEEKKYHKSPSAISISNPAEKDKLTIEKLALNKDPKYRETRSNLINRSSIAFLYLSTSGNILFMGDALPSTIIESLRDLKYSEKKPLKLKYMKLSHHGSKENFCSELLDIVRCKNFIISADGMNQHGLPDKEVLAKILKHKNRRPNKKIKFHFNYHDDRFKKIFDSDENARKRLNFSCTFPKPGKGLTIKL